MHKANRIQAIVCCLISTVLGISPAAAAEDPPAHQKVTFASPTLGSELTISVFSPAQDKTTHLVVYAHNGHWPSSGAPAPETVRDQLLAKGYAVAMLDYQGHAAAIMPDLWRDGLELADDKPFKRLTKAVKGGATELIVMPEGYGLRDDIHFFTSPDTGLEVSAIVIYPLQPASPVPLLIRQNGAIEWKGWQMAGSEFRGYAKAWVGHPFNFNGYKDIFPEEENRNEKTIAYGRAAVRTLRHFSMELNIDPERFGVYGASKHGNQSVWIGLTGDDESYAEEYAPMYAEESNRVQLVVGEPTMGFTEFYAEDQAPDMVFGWLNYPGEGRPDHEWLLARSWTRFLDASDPPMALDRCHGGHWRTQQISRLITSLHKLGIPMVQTLDRQLPNHVDNKDAAWLDFADLHLRSSSK